MRRGVLLCCDITSTIRRLYNPNSEAYEALRAENSRRFKELWASKSPEERAALCADLGVTDLSAASSSAAEAWAEAAGGLAGGPEAGGGATREADVSVSVAGGEGDELCVVCLDAARSALMKPCGHTSTCMACARRLPWPLHCPACREPIEGVLPWRDL